MTTGKKIIVAIIALIVIAAGVVITLQVTKSDSTKKNDTSSSSDTTTAAATITYSDSGFSPSTTTVKSGDTVAIKNTSSSVMQFDSNPHPVHTDDSDLNVGVVGAGETKTFTVTQKGTFNFHNHLDPSKTAKIIIE